MIAIVAIIPAETEGFEPSIRFPVYTLSRRASSTTRAGLRFLLFSEGQQKYLICAQIPNKFLALTVQIAAISISGISYIKASFSTTYFK